jgi:crotonobetainyl-CoA:carnitine CoA-transferase CaiB-like acyl-CoA transferase
MRFQQAPLSFDRPPPLLGEHTDEILQEFGLRVPSCDAEAQQ